MRTLFTGILICALTSMASAYSVWSAPVSFQSSKQAPKLATVASFDKNLYGDTLQSVTVEFYHKGSVVARVDNDDPEQMAYSTAKMIRTWEATGPGGLATGKITKSITGPDADLAKDNGDLGFDANGPDGYDYTPDLKYDFEPTAAYTPLKSDYETLGPGTVQFEISPVEMSNILDWVLGSTPPDIWQREVQLPDMTIQVKVTYIIPEPATLGLLSLGLAFFRRRFA